MIKIILKIYSNNKLSNSDIKLNYQNFNFIEVNSLSNIVKENIFDVIKTSINDSKINMSDYLIIIRENFLFGSESKLIEALKKVNNNYLIGLRYSGIYLKNLGQYLHIPHVLYRASH